MMTEHPSEQELQQFVSDNSLCTSATRSHIEGCESCQAQVASYGLVLSAIRQQPKPAFDFDVAALVLPQLQAPLSAEELAIAGLRPWKDRFFPFLLAVIILPLTGIPLYLLRKNIFFLFTDVSAIFIYAMAAAALVVIGFKIAGMYRTYQKQLKTLNFY
jgi:hypothetical protein